LERQYLFNTSKLEYVKGKKPDVSCILCAVIEGDDRVEDLTVYKDDFCTVALNLYPFNPGHLMIFPNRHVEELQNLTKNESDIIHRLTVLSVKIMDELLGPSGYNIGYNIGKGSGASISHLHQHIVPRYINEVGFLDVLAGARIVVSDPKDLMAHLRGAFKDSREEGK